MEEAFLVHVAKTVGDLVNNRPNHALRDPFPLGQTRPIEIEDVLINEVEDQVEFLIDLQNVAELDDVGVGHISERVDFSQLYALTPGLELIFELLDGHGLAGFFLLCLVHYSECSLSDNFESFIMFLHHCHSYFIIYNPFTKILPCFQQLFLFWG